MKAIVPEAIEHYAEAHSWAESDVCRRVREETQRTMEAPQMMVGPLEGAFLKMMARVTEARRVLEVGTFTGYSALCFAEAVPADGRVITCDVDQEAVALARRYAAESPHGDKIDFRVGPALETLATLTGPFDLIFIDADKINYPAYFNHALTLIRPGGLILIDNVLWSGDVLDRQPADASTAAIQEVTRRASQDPRLDCVLITIRDGVLVVRKS